MARFSKFPDGLLELLSSKHLGQAPDDLLDAVRGSVDMLPFWGAASIQIQSDGGTVQNTNDELDTIVPADQIWIPIQFAGDVIAGAVGETIRYSLGYRSPQAASNAYVVTADYSMTPAVSIGHHFRLGYKLAGQRILLLPGSRVNLSVDASGLTAARTAAVACSFIRISRT